MKTIFKIGAFVAVLLVVGCTDREAEARKAREDAEAKARAEAARKEMEALPKAFKSPPFFQRNVSGQTPARAPAPVAEEKKENSTP
jgi:predicted acylesterase/phospholipase RssA